MNANRETFLNNAPALATRLRGVRRVYSNNLNTSTFSLVFKHLPKQPKSSVMRRLGQVTIFVHKAQSKVFDCNQVVISNKPATDLVQIISPLIGDLLVRFSNLTVCFLLPIRAFDLSRGMVLQSA